jgi:hypothetical protein
MVKGKIEALLKEDPEQESIPDLIRQRDTFHSKASEKGETHHKV